MTKPPSLALLGATGALGREILTVLEERLPAFTDVTLYGSANTAGDELLLGARTLRVRAIPPGEIAAGDIAVVALPPRVREEVLPRLRAGVVLDALSDGATAPLLVGVNDGQVDARRPVQALPGDLTAIVAPVLAALHRARGLERAVITSFEAASGSGQRGMEALSAETLALFRRGEVGGGEEVNGHGDCSSPFPHQLAFNAIPQVGELLTDGRSAGERRLAWELGQLLGTSAPILATRVRAPWFSSHVATVAAKLTQGLDLPHLRSLLEATPGVALEDDPEDPGYPMPFGTTGRDEALVGRVRLEADGWVQLWICADNLRRGGAVPVVEAVAWWLERRQEADAS